MTHFRELTTFDMIFSGRYLGLWILALTAVLLLFGLIALVVSKTRRPFVWLLILAFIPFALALIGPFSSHQPRHVEMMFGQQMLHPRAHSLSGYIHDFPSWAMIFLGFGSTSIIALLALIGLAVKRGRVTDATPLAVVPAYTAAPSEPGVNRREILERLARKEISQEEAERLMDQAGEPIPEAPPPPPPTRSSGGRGCLIAVLVALAVIVLLAALLFFAAFFVRDSVQVMPARSLRMNTSFMLMSNREMTPILDGTAAPLLPAPNELIQEDRAD